MYKIIIGLCLAVCITKNSFAQYRFTDVKRLDHTEIKSQDKTGTCWSFATSSFLESELNRMGKGDLDLSEMFFVRNIYTDKAQNYMLRQGKANFSDGSLSHDVINAFNWFGAVPESAFSGKLNAEQAHNHGELSAALTGLLNGLLTRDELGTQWKDAFSAVLDVYLGKVPEKFEYEGKSYTPQSFAESLGIKTEDYISITSYTHRPFYRNFVLEIPDNYSNGSYQNLPIDELEKTVENAINSGFTVAWDGDVSEDFFLRKKGLAVLPKEDNKIDAPHKPVAQMEVSQEDRQRTFESYETTDDHLMHIVGIAKDQRNNEYYIVKNSWGQKGTQNGFIYMSKAYFRLKTVAILLHKDGIPKDIQAKMK